MDFYIGIPNSAMASSSSVVAYEDKEIYISRGVWAAGGNRDRRGIATIDFKQLDISVVTHKHEFQLSNIIKRKGKDMRRQLRRICYRILFECLAKAPSKFEAAIKNVRREAYEDGQRDQSRETAETLHGLLSPDF